MRLQKTRVVELDLAGDEPSHFEHSINTAKEKLQEENKLYVTLLQIFNNDAGHWFAIFLLFNPLARNKF